MVCRLAASFIAYYALMNLQKEPQTPAVEASL